MLEKVYPGALIAGLSYGAHEFNFLSESLAQWGINGGLLLAVLGAMVHAYQGPGQANVRAW